jgi:hypothetical protein
MNYPYYTVEHKNTLGLTRKERYQTEQEAMTRESELADDVDVMTVATAICEQTDMAIDACTRFSYHTKKPA